MSEDVTRDGETAVSELPVPREATPVEDDGGLPTPLVELLEAPPEVETPPVPGAAAAAAEAAPGAAKVEITCPSCGTVGQADIARREADDFCAACDYPLFWAQTRVWLPESVDSADGGLRRLPGTAGFAALAAVVCPACTEPNKPSAQTCVRCGADLHPAPVAEEPEPEPVAEPEPEPVVVAAVPWWRHWWVWAAAAGLLALVAIVLLFLFA